MTLSLPMEPVANVFLFQLKNHRAIVEMKNLNRFKCQPKFRGLNCFMTIEGKVGSDDSNVILSCLI